MATNQLLTTDDVGKLLKLHPNDVRRLVHAGKLKSLPVVVRGRGGCPRMRFRQDHITAYLDSLDDSAEVEETIERVKAPRSRRIKTEGFDYAAHTRA